MASQGGRARINHANPCFRAGCLSRHSCAAPSTAIPSPGTWQPSAIRLPGLSCSILPGTQETMAPTLQAETQVIANRTPQGRPRPGGEVGSCALGSLHTGPEGARAAQFLPRGPIGAQARSPRREVPTPFSLRPLRPLLVRDSVSCLCSSHVGLRTLIPRSPSPPFVPNPPPRMQKRLSRRAPLPPVPLQDIQGCSVQRGTASSLGQISEVRGGGSTHRPAAEGRPLQGSPCPCSGTVLQIRWCPTPQLLTQGRADSRDARGRSHLRHRLLGSLVLQVRP